MKDTGLRVTQLWRYPVKSMAGQALRDTCVSSLGIVGDRRLGVVDMDTGLVLTARRAPELLFARPVHVDARSGIARVKLPDGSVSGDSATLSDWLGRRVELRAAAPDQRGEYEIARDDDLPHGEWIRWSGPMGVFHDSTRTRLSIISEDALGSWDVRRFRANVVVRGGDERVLLGRRIAIGSVDGEVVKEIDRCVIVTRPQSGLPRDRAVLAQIHRERGGNFGVGVADLAPGEIALGAPILVAD